MTMKHFTLILLAALLTACGSPAPPDAGTATESEQAASEADGLDESAAAYQARVQKKMRESTVNSLAREWSVPHEQVRCVLNDLKLSQVQNVKNDPAAQAVFEKCGVDTAVMD